MLPQTERLVQRVLLLPTGTAVGAEDIADDLRRDPLRGDPGGRDRVAARRARSSGRRSLGRGRGRAAVKATVLLVTYNHAPYIGQALDSVLGQVTDFPWEIIISEDCSTDGTRAIVEQYARSHPDRIRLLLSERNRNDNEVIARGLRAAAGEFIAYLDGDDWWTVPHKLATQVRFLEQNPSCVMCYHSVLRIHEDGSRPPHPSLPPGPRPPMTLEDVLARYCINSCSVAFRRSADPELPDWYYSADLADWALSVLLSTRGIVGYVDEVMAAYRIHARGVWSGVTHRQRIEARLAFFDRLGADFRRRHARRGPRRAGAGTPRPGPRLGSRGEGPSRRPRMRCNLCGRAPPAGSSPPSRASASLPACSCRAGDAGWPCSARPGHEEPDRLGGYSHLPALCIGPAGHRGPRQADAGPGRLRGGRVHRWVRRRDQGDAGSPARRLPAPEPLAPESRPRGRPERRRGRSPR